MGARRLFLFIVLAVGLAILPAAASSTPEPDVGDDRRRPAVGGRLRRRLGSGLRDDAPHLRRDRRRLAGDVLAARPGTTSTRPRSTTPGTRTTASTRSGRRQHPAEPAVGARASSSTTTTRPTGSPTTAARRSRRGRRLPVRARLPGRLGPDCLRSWLEDPDGDGTATFETTALPAGSYDAKVAVNESWDENYGAGGVPGGDNIPFSVPSDHAKVTFTYNTTSHVLTIAVADPQGAPGALSHFDLARKDCLGTARNTTSKVWYTVAGGVLSDVYYPTIDNTNVETLRYVVTDGSTFTDLQGRDTTYTVAAIPGRAAWRCRVTTTAKSGKYADRHRLRDRPREERAADAGLVQAAARGPASGSTRASTRP